MATVLRRVVIWAVVVALATVIALVVTGCQQRPNSGEKAFKVDTADVTVEVLPDARLRVAERLRFRYSGSFSGAYRDIPLQDGVDLSSVQVSDGVDGTYEGGGATALGSYDRPGTFGVTTAPDGSARIVWHYAQEGGDRLFTVRYTVSGAAIATRDAVVVPWAVWGDQWRFWLNHLRASIRLRGGGAAAPLDVWMGPRDLGTDPEIQGGAATVRIERAKPGQQITLTAAFPRDAFTGLGGAIRRPRATLAGVRAEQQAAARDSFVHRLAATVTDVQIPLLICWTLIVGIAAMLLYRLSREHDAGVGRYVHGPPEDLPPAIGYALAHEGDYDDRVVLATLLDLVDRGVFKAQPTEGKELDLRLERRTDADLSGLAPFERKAHDFFDGLLEQGPCELGKLKDRIPEHSASWRKKWESMTAALKGAEGDAISWDRDLRPQRALATVIAFVGYAAILVLVWMRSGFFALPIVGLVAGMGLLYLFPGTWLRRRDEASIRRGEEWAAFARWTKDFPRLDDDPPATLQLWRRILVYGVAFGTADRLIKSGRIPAPLAEQDDGWSRGFMHGAAIGAFSGSSFSSGFSSQVAPQSSSSSSGGGGGGGFSGGGGGGAW